MADRLNVYQAGGVEKHPDGSFTIFGYIENQTKGLDIARHKVRYFDFSLKDARKKHLRELKDIQQEFRKLNIMTAEDFDNTYMARLPFGGQTLSRG